MDMFNKRRSRPLRHALSASFALVLVAHASLALAQDTAVVPASSGVDVAEQRAAQAFDAYQARDYSAAVKLYLEAFEAARSGDILFNIARIYDTKLGNRGHAIEFYRRYIAEPDAVSERIQIAKERLAVLNESQRVAREPLTGAVTGPGKSISTSRPGEPRAPTASDDGWSTAQTTGAVLGALGIVGVGFGVGFGAAAISDAGVSRDFCEGNACTDQRGVDAARDASRNVTRSVIGFAAGGALLGSGAALLLWGGGRQTEGAKSAGVRGAAVASSSGVSLEVTGTW